MKLRKLAAFILVIAALIGGNACSKHDKQFTKDYIISKSTKKAEEIKVVKPAENLPANVKAFSGLWTGYWLGTTKATLVVKEISENKAKVYYTDKKSTVYNFPGKTVEVEADLIKGKFATIYWENKKTKEIYKFVMSQDFKSVRSEYAKERVRFFNTMRRKDVNINALVKAVDNSNVVIKDKDNGLDKDWQKKSVFMEIYVRAYKDSDGDGIGDIKGLISKLDYLKDLGIGGIWLMPMFRNSDIDHGYAVEDYRTIEEEYGTLEDFKLLLKEAHKRKIGIIVDYVMNHSSSAHPYFIASRDKNSPMRNWYVWKDKERPKTWNVGWRLYDQNPWAETDGGYYYSIFFNGMPDYNLRNPEVLKFHFNNMKYWLNIGVDGFRFDAVGHFHENAPNGWDGQPGNTTLLKKIKALLNKYTNKYMVCEATSESHKYVDAAGSAFAFGLQSYFIGSGRSGKAIPRMKTYLDENPVENMGTFLSNHDWFAGYRPHYETKQDEARTRLCGTTLLLCPGIPFVYYGEEIGMDISEELFGDHTLRSPMSWTDDEDNAGFSTSKTIYRKPSVNVSSHNLEDEINDEDSMYHHYKKLIKLRTSNKTLAMGKYKLLKNTGNKKNTIFAFERAYKDEKAIVIINYSKEDENNVTVTTIDKNAKFKALYPENLKEITSSGTAEIKVEVPAEDFVIYQLAK